MQWKDFDVNEYYIWNNYSPSQWHGHENLSYQLHDIWIYSETHRYSTTDNCYDINSDAVIEAIDKVKQFIININEEMYGASSILLYVPNPYLFQQQVIARILFPDAALLKSLHTLYALECEAARLASAVYAFKCSCGEK